MNDDILNTPTPSSSTTLSPDNNLDKKLKPLNTPAYPYNGKAKNLFNRFIIIGYEPKFISKVTQSIVDQCVENPIQYANGYKMNSRPSILNTISYDYSAGYLDNDIILELIFPDYPYVFYMKNSHVKTANLGSSGIIFSLSPQDNNNSKKSCNGFAYLFYENERHSSSGSFLAFPKVFCFISEYPYFAAFYNLSQKIVKLFTNDSLTFSLEAVMYNLVNFIPAPLHFSIDLAIWKVVSSTSIEDTTTTMGESVSTRRHSDSITEHSSKMDKPRSHKKKSSVNSRHTQKDDDYVYFPQISGYPLMNFNLPLFFNIFPAHLIIQVFIFTFLETDILFYSSNLELLNLLMYVFSSLNYPCNESIYFWHILSVSIQSFMNSTSTFVGKTCSTIIGINNTYDPRVKTTLRIREHFVLDIDRKEFSYVSSSDSPESAKNRIIFEGLNRIINNTSSCVGGPITEMIKNLYNNLNSIAKKLMQFNSNNSNTVNTNMELYKYDDQIAKHNRSIQNMFYSFILDISMMYYHKYKIGIGDEDEKKLASSLYSTTNKVIRANTNSNSNNKQDDTNYYMELHTDVNVINEFEGVFCERFKESSKFGTYLINFMLFYDTIDLYKIPLLFSEEFINRRHDSPIEENQMYNYMDIIDNLYFAKTEDEIHKIGTSKKDAVAKSMHKVINFNEFYAFAETNLRNDFLRQQRTDSEYIEIWMVGQTVKAKYRKCEVNQRSLFDYTYVIQNLSNDEMSRIFPMKVYLNDNINIKQTKQKIISDIIERNLIKQKAFTKMEFIIFSIFSIFTITRDISNDDNDDDAITETVLLTKLTAYSKYNLRKYFMNLLQTIQTLYIRAYKESDTPKQLHTYTRCYNILRDYILTHNVVPNEEFMALISSDIIPYTKQYSNDNKDEDNHKHSYNANFEFEYINTGGFLNESEKLEHEKKMWIYSDNLDICSEICMEVESEERSSKLSRQSRDSKDSSTKGAPLEIECSIITNGDNNVKMSKVIKFYSPLKLFNESNKLVTKYMNKLELSDIEKNKLLIIIWNLVYYIYLIQTVVPDIYNQDKKENEYKDFPFEIQNVLLSYYERIASRIKGNINTNDDDNDIMVLSIKDKDNEVESEIIYDKYI